MNVGSGSRRHFIALALAACGALPLRAAPRGRTVLVVGDSLSAEYGLARGTGWVALLEKRLADGQLPVRVVNASISGDTTSGGRARLPALLAAHHPDVVVLELGANDALRGLPLDMTEANLLAMAQAAHAAGARVLVVGVQVPPNYGPDYARRFEAVFASVAKRAGAGLVPSMLRGIADDPQPLRWFQADRIHPVAQAHPRILDNIWPELRKLLR